MTHIDMDPRTADLIEATRELLAISKRLSPHATKHGVHHKPDVVTALRQLSRDEVEPWLAAELVDLVRKQEGN
ncbi:hypothetical protein N9T35_00660 [bacterium]|nr:hypothetical protein [bacterium]